MKFELQPQLRDRLIRLEPLQAADFDALYAVAADPLIWEQHPNRNRYQRAVFDTYFQGAIESGGAFSIIDNAGGRCIGSSRYYDLDEARSEVRVGYTFLARSTWGRGYNRALKILMLDHAFRFVERVVFHVGAENMRSRKAMEKLGGIYLGDAAISYYGEAVKQNVVYKIDKADWPSAPRL